MRRWFTPLLFGVLLSMPAPADASPLNLDDEHLYLRQEQAILSVYRGGPRHWGWRHPPVYRQIQPLTIITKGEIPISGERFIELIARSKADQPLVEHIKNEEKARFNWGLTALGSFAVFGFGLGFSDTPDNTKQTVGNGIAIAC